MPDLRPKNQPMTLAEFNAEYSSEQTTRARNRWADAVLREKKARQDREAAAELYRLEVIELAAEAHVYVTDLYNRTW